MKIRNLFISLILFLAPYLHGEIIETNQLTDVLDYVTENTLVVFDLDNTLIKAQQTLGSDQWFSHEINQNMKQGLDLYQAIDNILPLYFHIQDVTAVTLTEPCIPNILQKLNNMGIQTMALTTRSPQLARRTFQLLREVNIKFKSNISHEFILEPEFDSRHIKHCLFVGNANKGEILSLFLKQCGLNPQRIIFIDDKINHVKNVAKAVEQLDIEFIGLRYSGLDDEIKKFDDKIAEIQRSHLDCILTDEEALRLLKEES